MVSDEELRKLAKKKAKEKIGFYVITSCTFKPFHFPQNPFFHRR
jgi:hypothetical protein